MSNLANEEALLNAVAGCPGATAGAIAHHLGMDRSNTRRDLKKLWRDGKVIGQDDGGKLRFYLAGDAQSYAAAQAAKSAQSPQVIDGVFKVLSLPNGSQASSESRALVPSTGAPATFDSRLAGTLARNERARRTQQDRRQVLPGQAVALLNQCFTEDQDETWAALQRAQLDRLKAATAHEQWLREEHARQVEKAEKRKEAEAKKKRDHEIAWAIRSLLHSPEEQEPPRRRSNIRSLAYEEEEEPEPLPSIDRFQQRQRELSERAESASIWEAERLAKQGPDSAKAREPTRRPDTVRQLLARAKSAPLEPPAKSWWQWPVAITALGVFAVIVVISPLQQ